MAADPGDSIESVTAGAHRYAKSAVVAFIAGVPPARCCAASHPKSYLAVLNLTCHVPVNSD